MHRGQSAWRKSSKCSLHNRASLPLMPRLVTAVMRLRWFGGCFPAGIFTDLMSIPSNCRALRPGCARRAFRRKRGRAPHQLRRAAASARRRRCRGRGYYSRRPQHLLDADGQSQARSRFQTRRSSRSAHEPAAQTMARLRPACCPSPKPNLRACWRKTRTNPTPASSWRCQARSANPYHHARPGAQHSRSRAWDHAEFTIHRAPPRTTHFLFPGAS